MSMQFDYLELEAKGKGHIQDISASGLGLVTKRRMTMYAPLEVRINLPLSSEALCITGEVVWVQRVDFSTYRAGIKFDSPSLIGVWRVLNEAHLHAQSPPKETGVKAGDALCKCAQLFAGIRSRVTQFF